MQTPLLRQSFTAVSFPSIVSQGDIKSSSPETRKLISVKEAVSTARAILDKDQGGTSAVPLIPDSHLCITVEASAKIARSQVDKFKFDPQHLTVVDVMQYPADAAVNQQAMLWFPDAFAYVNVDLGPEFRGLISSWVALERTSQWKTNPSVRLPTINRPTLLAEWVDKKRYKSRLNEPDMYKDCGTDFAESVKKWWSSLQTAWRQESGRDISSSQNIGSHNWKHIDKFGLNGWFGILVCLKWWGTNLQYQLAEKTESKHKWLETVEEVHIVVEALIEYRRKAM
ncbi:protein [Lentinula edodes]|uniref:Protein n=2 Tax=Lentinula edodes TaxID=5353 RepID=A0A1Q3E1T9_LENED|nr:protein [Lentinula edodes]